MRSRFALLALALGACSDPGPGPWVQAEDHRWRELSPRGAGGFARLDAPARGIGFRYDPPETARLRNRVLAEGQGVAIGDIDGDDRPDLFLAGFTGPSALYRNLGDWRFEDVTASVGPALDDVMVRGAALVDVDGDANLDLALAVHGGRNRIYSGDGTGRFEEVEGAGLTGEWGSTTPALADIDGDGDLDLYIANYKIRQVDDLYPPDVLDIGLLQPGSDGALLIPPELRDLYAQHYEVEFDGRFVRRFELGEPDELYLNAGDGRFEAVSLRDRFAGADGSPLAPPRDWGLAARFSDWDEDGDPDLYVASDFNSPDGIWLNQGDASFRAAGPLVVRTTSLSSMAVDVGDLDRDGDLDLVTTDMRARDPTVMRAQTPNFEPAPEAAGVIDTRVQVNRNAVQLNRGDGTFAEAAWELGLAASDWTWGAAVVDADLDGWDDLLVTTGHAWDLLDGDANARVLPGLPAEDALRTFGPLRQPNAAFRGGPSGFTDESASWGWGGEPDISHGLALGDLDGDGDMDAVVTRLGDAPILYRNDAAAPRVLVRLSGSGANPYGIGARVRLLGHPAGTQVREIAAGGAYLSSSEPAASFAAVEGADLSLVIDWPDGRRTRVEGVIADREYDVTDANARPIDDPPNRTPLHFADVSAGPGHRHVESPFDDRARQPLLPHSLDRLGPGVSWLDADGDGDADLVVGSGRGGSPVLMRNDAGVLGEPRAVTPALDLDATTLLPHGLPGGRAGLLIGLSAYEALSPTDVAEAPAAITVPLGRGSGAGTPRSLAARAAGVRAPPAATGPLAQADIDGDGDLDVFLGGRVSPALYPRPVGSRILRNEGGELRPDDEGSAPFATLGLVSGAVFTDFDVDGDPDLALALEWGPIRIFRNEDGRFTDDTEALGLGDLLGRWNGISAGDFDEDGRPDLVATNWGSNLEVPPAYSLLYGDMNRDGLLDMIEATRGAGGWYAIRRRDALARPTDDLTPGLPSLAGVPYGRFATTPIEELIGGLDTTVRVDATELRHTVLLNRATSFERAPLPRAAQRAPAFGVATGDLDGDGHEDLILAQNFYAGRRGVPRYDAGRGIWLRGDGSGAFEAVPGQTSGIEVYGDARAVALADFDADGRLDIAFGVNGGLTRLYRNELAEPGLRVVLVASAGNPEAIGARLRIEYEDGSLGPVREVRSGEGYWSRGEAAQTMGLAAPPRSVQIVWPGGARSSSSVPAGAREVRAVAPS